MGVHFPAVDWIMLSGSASGPGCQGSGGIVPNRPASSSIYARTWSVRMLPQHQL